MLIAYATIPGYVANRDIFRGSWFVEAICKVFASQSAEKDIREMMDEVRTSLDFLSLKYFFGRKYWDTTATIAAQFKLDFDARSRN